jgi:hypothetical protein
VQFEQSPLQEHLISSRQALDTSGIVIQTGTHEFANLLKEKSSGEGMTCCVCMHVAILHWWYSIHRSVFRAEQLLSGVIDAGSVIQNIN